MEEKLLELIKTAIEYEKVSTNNYIEIYYVGKDTIEIHIRNKHNFEFISSTEINLKNNIFIINDVISKIRKMIEEEEKQWIMKFLQK